MACYCKWGGRKPTINQIIQAAENYERHNNVLSNHSAQSKDAIS